MHSRLPLYLGCLRHRCLPRHTDRDAPVFRRSTLAAATTSAVLVLSGCASAPEQAPEPAVASDYACGQLKIRVAAVPERDLLGLDYRDKRILLKPVDGDASLFQAPGDRSTHLQYRDGRAELTIRGETYPECLPPGALERSFTVRGSDPVWHARVAGDELIVSQPYEDQAPVRLSSRLANADRHGREFIAEADGLRATLTVATQLCRDPVSGAQYPNQARLTLNGDSYTGCGGDPQRLIRGAEWAVTELSAQGIIDRSKVTLRFLDDHRVAGRASCNRFTGQYRLLDDGGIEFSELATARMACAPSLMVQEERFIGALERASVMRIGQQGQLVLSTSGNPLLTAAQSDQETP